MERPSSQDGKAEDATHWLKRDMWVACDTWQQPKVVGFTHWKKLRKEFEHHEKVLRP